MRQNPVKEKLKNGEMVFGTMVSDLRSPGISQMLATAGFELLVFDSEHSSFSIQTVADHIVAARAADIVSVVRVPNRKYDHLLSRPLDAGAQGLLVPNIHTVEETKNVIKHTKYYPEGQRGTAFKRIHSDFLPRSAAEIIKESNQNVLIIIQIESKQAVDQIDQIVSVPGVDAAFIGPNDLSQSLGVPGLTNHPVVEEQIEKVIKACQDHHVTPGIHVHRWEDAKKWLNKGMRLLLYLSDINMIMKAATEAMTELNKLL